MAIDDHDPLPFNKVTSSNGTKLSDIQQYRLISRCTSKIMVLSGFRLITYFNKARFVLYQSLFARVIHEFPKFSLWTP